MKQGSNDTFLVSKDFLTGPWRHTKALSALSGTFFLNSETFGQASVLPDSISLQVYCVFFNTQLQLCWYLSSFFMIVIMSNAVPSPWREVVPLSGDCVDTYSTSVLFVCILGFFFLKSILRKWYSSYIVKKKRIFNITPALLYEIFCDVRGIKPHLFSHTFCFVVVLEVKICVKLWTFTQHESQTFL